MKQPQLVYEEPCVKKSIALLNDEDDERYKEYISTNLQKDDNSYKSKNNHEEKRSLEQQQKDEFTDKFAILFYRITGKDEVLDAYELQTVMERMHANELQNFNNNTFSLETCRCMVASIDKNRRGTLNFDQFKRLWHMIMSWKDLFDECDLNKDQKIDENELRVAVDKLGFKLRDETLNVLGCRYANRSGTLNLDDFCGVCSKLQTLQKSFNEMCASNKELTYDRYLMDSLYS